MLFLNSFKLIPVSLWNHRSPQSSWPQWTTYYTFHFCSHHRCYSPLSLHTSAYLAVSWVHPSSSLFPQLGSRCQHQHHLLSLPYAFQIQVRNSLVACFVIVASLGDSWEGIPAGWSLRDSARVHCRVLAYLNCCFCFHLRKRSLRDSNGFGGECLRM
jgi:hypothetical protein